MQLISATETLSRTTAPIITGNARWYAAHVRVNQEKVVSALLATRDLQGYVPVYKSKRNWSDRVKELELPLFPGYVFCRIAPEKKGAVQKVPGVIRIVGAGRTPIAIDDSEMDMLRIIAESDIPRQPYPMPAVGDAVEIRGGPLAGIFGILASVKDSRKLVVSISLLQRSVAVEFDEMWVTGTK